MDKSKPIVACFSIMEFQRKYFIQSMQKLKQEDQFKINFIDQSLNSENVEQLIAKDQYNTLIITNFDKIDAACLKKLKQLGVNLLSLCGAGYNNIDVKEALQQNIKLVRVPAYCPQSIAEQGFALLLTYIRNIHKAYYRMHDYNFSVEGLLGFTLNQKTIGIIGCGNIGTSMMQIAKGFGMQILVTNRSKVQDILLQKYDAKQVNLEQLYKESDIISLNVPLTKETEYMINKDSIAKMKQNVIILNTSRGSIVKSTDILSSINENKIGGYVADVYENEYGVFWEDRSISPPQDPILAQLIMSNKVLMTPHIAAQTTDALQQITFITINNIIEIFSQGLSKNEIKI